MFAFLFILLVYGNEIDTSHKETELPLFQSENCFINFLQLVYLKIISIFRVCYENITQPLSIKSIFSRHLEVYFNNSQYQTNFTFFEDLAEKIYDNKIIKYQQNNNITDSNPKSTHASQHPKIQKLEITNPYSILLTILLIQALNVLDLLTNLPFDNFNQFTKYIHHLPAGTKRLFKMMVYLHCLTIVMLFINDEFLAKLFGESTYSVFGELQFWRIITSTYLHADPMHLFSNMFEFILCGPYFEKSVGTDFFYFHIYCISIMISVIEGIIHFAMFLIGFTERINVLSIGFSGVIFALYIISGSIARKKGRSNRIKVSRRRSNYSPVSFNRASSGSSSSASVSPSNLYLVGTRTSYRDFFSNEMVPWYLLIVTFLLSPTSSFTAHFAGIIAGEIYVHFLEPNNFLVTNKKFVKKFNLCFPWILVAYFFYYWSFMV